MRLIDANALEKTIRDDFGCSDCKGKCRKCAVGMILVHIKKSKTLVDGSNHKNE